MNRTIDDLGTFKSGPMQEHLMAKGLLFSTHILSAKGRAAYHEVHSLLHDVEHEEVQLLDDAGRLKARLDELGSNVVLLPEGFREKLRESPLADAVEVRREHGHPALQGTTGESDHRSDAPVLRSGTG